MQKRSSIASFDNAMGQFIPDPNYTKGEGVQNLMAVTSFSCELITVRTTQLNRSSGKQFITFNIAESVNYFVTEAQIKPYAKARLVMRRVRGQENTSGRQP